IRSSCACRRPARLQAAVEPSRKYCCHRAAAAAMAVSWILRESAARSKTSRPWEGENGATRLEHVATPIIHLLARVRPRVPLLRSRVPDMVHGLFHLILATSVD